MSDYFIILLLYNISVNTFYFHKVFIRIYILINYQMYLLDLIPVN